MIRSVNVEIDGVRLYRDINRISVLTGAVLNRKKLRASATFAAASAAAAAAAARPAPSGGHVTTP